MTCTSLTLLGDIDMRYRDGRALFIEDIVQSSRDKVPPMVIFDAQYYYEDTCSDVLCPRRIKEYTRFTADDQERYFTYIIDTAPRSDLPPCLVDALGTPLRIKATSLGSAYRRCVFLWTKLGRHWNILDYYLNNKTCHPSIVKLNRQAG
jgi:hypothetical protein